MNCSLEQDAQPKAMMNQQPLRQLYCPGLPLAVYREVAAHLRQVVGVDVVLLPQTATQFDYRQSQVGGLQIQYAEEINPRDQARIEQILSYYGDRYGAWRPLETPATPLETTL